MAPADVRDGNLAPNNLWEIARAKASAATGGGAAAVQEQTSSQKKVFVFVGDKGVGKTNLVLKMLDI